MNASSQPLKRATSPIAAIGVCDASPDFYALRSQWLTSAGRDISFGQVSKISPLVYICASACVLSPAPSTEWMWRSKSAGLIHDIDSSASMKRRQLVRSVLSPENLPGSIEQPD